MSGRGFLRKVGQIPKNDRCVRFLGRNYNTTTRSFYYVLVEHTDFVQDYNWSRECEEKLTKIAKETEKITTKEEKERNEDGETER